MLTDKILIYLSMFLLMTALSSSAQINKTIPSITQGITGYVYFVSGNQMPSPGKKPSPPKGIKTTVYICQLTNISQVTRQGQSAFYSSIKTKIIKETESDSTGYFSVQLEPGMYSLFTKTSGVFYANIFDGNNNIAPAKVIPQKITEMKISIDYNSTN
jgi:hypothetical protein